MRVGVHVSIAKALDLAIDRAIERDCNVFQIFTRNPRGWSYKPLEKDQIEKFSRKMRQHNFDVVVSHMPYLPNLASPRDEVYEKSVDTLIAELDRCEKLGIKYLVIHLGSHLGLGMENGFKRLTSALERAIHKSKGETMMLLENTAGTKNSLGSRFQDIKYILDSLDNPKEVGICFDTCHAFAAGYDLRTEKSLDNVLKEFDSEIGLDLIKIFHLNDSKGEINNRLDRHEHIGLGNIGEKGFITMLKHNKFKNTPLILETPVNEARDDIGNVMKVKELEKLGTTM